MVPKSPEPLADNLMHVSSALHTNVHPLQDGRSHSALRRGISHIVCVEDNHVP